MSNYIIRNDKIVGKQIVHNKTASEVSYDSATSGLNATTVQSAIDETIAKKQDVLSAEQLTAVNSEATKSKVEQIQTNRVDIAELKVNMNSALADIELKANAGDVYNKLDIDTKFIKTTEKGINNGVATLDASGKIPQEQLNLSAEKLKGMWDASTNTPTLQNSVGELGDTYICSVAGTVDFGAGEISFNEGDKVIYINSIWNRNVTPNAVQSVNSKTGNVTITAEDIFTEEQLLKLENSITSSDITEMSANVQANTANIANVQTTVTGLDTAVTNVQAEVDVLENAKQDALSTEQIDATNSGITAAKLTNIETAISEASAQIATNTGTISNLQTANASMFKTYVSLYDLNTKKGLSLAWENNVDNTQKIIDALEGREEFMDSFSADTNRIGITGNYGSTINNFHIIKRSADLAIITATTNAGTILNRTYTNGTLSDWCVNIAVYTSLSELGLTADATFQDVVDKLPKGASALLGVKEFTNYQTIFPYEEGNDQFARTYIVKGVENGSSMYARWFRKDGVKEAIAKFHINTNKFDGWQDNTTKEILHTSLTGNLAGITTVLDLVNTLVEEYRALSSKKPVRFVSEEIGKTTLTDLPQNSGLLQITVVGYDGVEISYAGSSFGFKTLHLGTVNRVSGEALFSSITWKEVATKSIYNSAAELNKAKGTNIELVNGEDNTKKIVDALSTGEQFISFYHNNANQNRFGIDVSYGNLIHELRITKCLDADLTANYATVTAFMNTGCVLSRIFYKTYSTAWSSTKDYIESLS